MLSSSSYRLGNSGEVGGKYSPANPAAKTCLSSIPAAAQVAAPLEHADASFRSRSKAQSTAEPALTFMAFALDALSSGLGQDHAFDSSTLGSQLVARGVAPSVCSEEPWRMTEEPLMMDEAGHGLAGIDGVALQNPVATDDATIHLIQPDLPSELGLMPGLTPADDPGVGLKQAHQLLLRWYGYPFQHPELCLADNLLDQRGEVVNLTDQPLGGLVGYGCQSFAYQPGLPQAGLRYSQEILVSNPLDQFSSLPSSP